MSDVRLPRRAYVGLQLASAPGTVGGQRGLWVRGVAPGSSAEAAGVLAGDLLTHVDQNAAADLHEVRLLLRAVRSGAPLTLRVVRVEGAGASALELHTHVQGFPVEQYPGAATLLDQVRVGEHYHRVIAVVPKSATPCPVLYYLPGAHWASEEYPLQPDHPLPSLVNALAAHGVATLRVERSGLGDSQGPSCTRVDFDGEEAGFAAGLDYLGGVPWADASQLHLFGHSIGAMVAPLIARRRSVRSVLTFGASAVPISRALVGAIERHAEIEEPRRAGARGVARQIAEIIRRVVVDKCTPDQVFAERADLAAIAPEHFRGDQAYHRIVTFYHQLEERDLLGAWSALGAPVLAIHGERDWISTLDDSRELVAHVGESAEIAELPGVDHHLSDAPDGHPARLAGALRDTVVEWLRRHGAVR